MSEYTPADLSVPKVAATLWVAQIVRLHELLATVEGVCTLDSDMFFKRTEVTLQRLAGLFEINISADRISGISNSNLFSRYSKNPSMPYSAETREITRTRALAEFGEEIREGMEWGAGLMRKCDIPRTVPNALF